SFLYPCLNLKTNEMKTLFSILVIPFLFSCGEETIKNLTTEKPPEILVDMPIAQQPVKGPIIELVFCLDATGSMSGLIATAKEKIWSIVSELSQTQPAPRIKLGMVFYRDRGDAYITKVIPMTLDIDSVYTELLAIQAGGGGDTPESVNQALHEAVSQMNWTRGNKVYKTVFLVGDCAPHMDYKNDVKYQVTCKLASEKGITLNTIKLGTQCTDAISHFKAIAECSNGEYQQLGQHAEDLVIKTPYDDSINYYSKQIDASKMYYGSSSEQSFNYSRKSKAMKIYSEASSSANTDRAKYNMSESGRDNWFGKKELINDLIANKISLDSISEDELPAEIKKIKKANRKQYVLDKKKNRDNNLIQLKGLNLKKAEYIKAEIAKNPAAISFSGEIIITMKEQAKENGVIIGK
ncbi:MAG: VWA domain-containing protein, partial [Flavobacteriales bacterium]|nr:VWA domain-containing protein [Flavobacteriales bacterium]